MMEERYWESDRRDDAPPPAEIHSKMLTNIAQLTDDLKENRTRNKPQRTEVHQRISVMKSVANEYAKDHGLPLANRP